MTEKKTEKRNHPRSRVSFFLDCDARLEKPIVAEAIIEDVSWGGLRMHFRKTGLITDLKADDRVEGKIQSENPALQMSFSGTVMWVIDFQDTGETSQRVGIKFDENVIFSEVLLSLRPARPSGEQV